MVRSSQDLVVGLSSDTLTSKTGEGAGAAGVVALSSGPQNLVSPPGLYRLPSSNSAADQGVRLRYWSTTFRYQDSIASEFIVELLLSAMSGGRLR